MTTQATYTIGPPTRPRITHDNGHLDTMPRRSASATDYAQLAYWSAKLEGAEAAQGVPLVPHNDIPDALAAYRHFLEGGGADRTVDYDRFLTNDSSGRTVLRNAIIEAQNAAYDLYRSEGLSAPCSFEFTGTRLAVSATSARFPYPATENWQKALGAHPFWISGSVTVSGTAALPSFSLVMTIHAEDRYNFNPGAADIATGIPDSANGVFEVTGLAHQYTNYGTATRTVTWSGAPGAASGAASVSGAPRLRQRQPQDNRRVRNRL